MDQSWIVRFDYQLLIVVDIRKRRASLTARNAWLQTRQHPLESCTRNPSPLSVAYEVASIAKSVNLRDVLGNAKPIRHVYRSLSQPFSKPSRLGFQTKSVTAVLNVRISLLQLYRSIRGYHLVYTYSPGVYQSCTSQDNLPPGVFAFPTKRQSTYFHEMSGESPGHSASF